MNILHYEDVIKEVEKSSNISAVIVKKIEEEINEIILLYLRQSKWAVIEINELLNLYSDLD